MPRFYVAPEDWKPDSLVLRGAEAHHCRDVLRMKPGDELTVFNGCGVEITAEITSMASREIQLRKLRQQVAPPPACRITLGQAIPKGKNMDLIVQKAVELGAAEIVPLVTERTVVQFDARGAMQKQSKWQTVAIEAAKQCGQNWLPQVRIPQRLAEFFSAQAATSPASNAFPRAGVAAGVSAGSDASPRADVEAGLSPATSGDRPTRPPLHHLALIASLESDARSLKAVLRHCEATCTDKPRTVLVLIGPEGDFTAAEYTLARKHGCQPITFGPIVLRVETAAMCCLSALSYELSTYPAAEHVE